MKKKKIPINWRNSPEEHDYPAAFSYLSLIYEKDAVEAIMKRLKKAKVVGFKAKDAFRAAGLSLLGISNHHVETNRRKILAGEKLSPILLVRDPKNGKVIIADGYHRMCSVYAFDEDAVLPCKIV
jgi:hypothetical protein